MEIKRDIGIVAGGTACFPPQKKPPLCLSLTLSVFDGEGVIVLRLDGVGWVWRVCCVVSLKLLQAGVIKE